MKEFIALFLNTIVYPLVFSSIIFLGVELITLIQNKKININPKKKGFYVILFGTVIFWSFIVSFVKWLI